MRRITFHPAADAEVAEAVEYYESRSVGLGSDLLGELEYALAQILAHPETYQLISRRTRRKPLWRFPYNLVYAIYPDRIRIVAFAHQKRRPFYWWERIKQQTQVKNPTKP